ncbi:MAG: tetratricopeptide repeat protein, partial [Opitutaceae bacterium]
MSSLAASDPSGAGRRAARLGAAAIALATTLAYLGSFRGVLVLDDLGTIARNPTLQGLWSSLEPPRSGLPTAGRPVANFSFALNAAISGGRLWSFHLLNLTIHVGAALALFGILRRVLRPYSAPLAAFAAALLWAVHPLNTAAVTYLSQRVESLMGLFFLATLYAYLRFAEAQDAGRPGAAARWAVLSVGACLLGVGTKEVIVAAPLLVLLYDRGFLAGSFRGAWRRRGACLSALFATWIPLAALVARTGSRGGTAGFGSAVPWWAYALTQVRAVAHYLRLAFWPHPLIADYGRILGGPPAALARDFALLASLVCVGAVLLVKRSPWGFLAAWFFVILAPSSSVVPVATEIIAEQRMYLPLAAVVTAAVCGTVALGRRCAARLRWTRAGTAAAGSMLLAGAAAALAAVTFARNRVYRSPLAFWSDAAAEVPGNAGAWNNLGNALADRGRIGPAEADYRRSLSLAPAFSDAHINLGNLLLRTGRPAEAMGHYEAALKYRAGDRRIRRQLGIAAYRAGNARMDAGRLNAAAADYAVTVRMSPEFADARVNYGGVLAELGR